MSSDQEKVSHMIVVGKGIRRAEESPFLEVEKSIMGSLQLMRRLKSWKLTQIGSSKALGPEKAMATHSSTLAWKIPWTEEPGGLQSMGLLGVGHDWVTSLPLFTFMHWRRKWQPAPVFLPGEAQGRWSLMGCRLWGRTELDTTETT